MAACGSIDAMTAKWLSDKARRLGVKSLIRIAFEPHGPHHADGYALGWMCRPEAALVVGVIVVAFDRYEAH